MALNKSGIEYLTHGWNPTIGCRHGCSYCYSRVRWAPRRKGTCALCAGFVPHIHAERLEDSRRRRLPARIGVGFHSDIFGEWDWPKINTDHAIDVEQDLHVHPLDLWATLAAIMFDTPQHRYLILTKNPEGIPTDLPLPPNLMLGTSVTLSPETVGDDNHRMYTLVNRVPEGQRVLSIAPCRSEGPLAFSDMPFDWVIIEGETGKHAHGLEAETVAPLLDMDVPVWVKGNALLPGWRQELPELLKLPEEKEDGDSTE